MATKTAWEHILDEPLVTEPGETPMKVDIDARFEGSVEQFIAWVNDTFKNPNDLTIRAVVGNSARPMPGPRTSEIDVPAVVSKPARQLVKTYGITEEQASALVGELSGFLTRCDRIGAIKRARLRMSDLGAGISMGLKEAKDFVESLLEEPSNADDEIPF